MVGVEEEEEREREAGIDPVSGEVLQFLPVAKVL